MDTESEIPKTDSATSAASNSETSSSEVPSSNDVPASSAASAAHASGHLKVHVGWTRARITAAVICAVLVVCAVGAWVWHGTPGFCGTLCHASMANYSATYQYNEGEAGTDKWGNEVSDASAMLVVSHKAEGKVCLDCHVPSLSQQLSEVGETISGDYYYPLDEVGIKELMENAGRGNDSDQFCINDACHSDISREALTEKTSDLEFNPHDWEAHGEIPCSNCHKSHRASTLYCTECHNEAEAILPDGWLTYAEGAELENDALDS